MTFGYDARVIGNTSVATVRDIARALLVWLRNKREDYDSDPSIVFIGHDLGGIIIKQVWSSLGCSSLNIAPLKG